MNNINNQLSDKLIERICKIYTYLDMAQAMGREFVSSFDLAHAVGSTSYSIRKDMSLLKLTETFTRKGYSVELLKNELNKIFNFSKVHTACIVGLGRLGTALLAYENFEASGINIVAAFDSNINKLEQISTKVELFGASRIEDVVRSKGIELGIIAVPSAAAQDTADKLVRGGVKGILNFSPAGLKVKEGVVFHNMDFTGALRFIAVRI